MSQATFRQNGRPELLWHANKTVLCTILRAIGPDDTRRETLAPLSIKAKCAAVARSKLQEKRPLSLRS